MSAEQVLRAALQEFLTEIQAMAELQAMARNQERQSERLDDLDGRIANMATYLTVTITLLSIMVLGDRRVKQSCYENGLFKGN